VQNGNAIAHVAQRHGQKDRFVGGFRGRAATWCVHGVLVDEGHFLVEVLLA